jgi:hypothetical protein
MGGISASGIEASGMEGMEATSARMMDDDE